MEQPNTYSTDYAQPDSTLLLQYNFCMNETSHLGMPSEGELIFTDRNSISVSAYKRNNCPVSSSGVKKELLRCTAGHCRRIHHDGPVSWCDVHPWSLSSQATISQFHLPPQKLLQDLSNILFYREQLPLEKSLTFAPITGLSQAKGQPAPAGLSPPDSFHRYPGTV